MTSKTTASQNGLLAELLPMACAKTRKRPRHLPFAEALTPHCRLSNLEAAETKHIGFNQWQATLRLRTMPEGLTPVVDLQCADPLADEKQAHALLVAALATANRLENRPRAAATDGGIAFDLADARVPIPRALLDDALPFAVHDPRGRERIRREIDELNTEIFGTTRPGQEHFDNLGPTAQRRLQSVLVFAVAKGIFRHPEPRLAEMIGRAAKTPISL